MSLSGDLEHGGKWGIWGTFQYPQWGLSNWVLESPPIGPLSNALNTPLAHHYPMPQMGGGLSLGGTWGTFARGVWTHFGTILSQFWPFLTDFDPKRITGGTWGTVQYPNWKVPLGGIGKSPQIPHFPPFSKSPDNGPGNLKLIFAGKIAQ